MAEEKHIMPEAAKALGIIIISCGLMEYPDKTIKNLLDCKETSQIEKFFDSSNEQLPERIKSFLDRNNRRILDSKGFLKLFGPDEHFAIANSPYSKVWPELTNLNVKTVGHVLLPYPPEDFGLTEVKGVVKVPGEGPRVVHFATNFPLSELSNRDIEELAENCKNHKGLQKRTSVVPLIDYSRTSLRKKTEAQLRKFGLLHNAN